MMTVVKYGSEYGCSKKLTDDRISNNMQYEECGSIPVSWAIMRDWLRWLGQILRMKDDRLSKIVLSAKRQELNRTQVFRG